MEERVQGLGAVFWGGGTGGGLRELSAGRAGNDQGQMAIASKAKSYSMGGILRVKLGKRLGIECRARGYRHVEPTARAGRGLTQHWRRFAVEEAIKRGAADAELARGFKLVATVQVEDEMNVPVNDGVEVQNLPLAPCPAFGSAVTGGGDAWESLRRNQARRVFVATLSESTWTCCAPAARSRTQRPRWIHRQVGAKREEQMSCIDVAFPTPASQRMGTHAAASCGSASKGRRSRSGRRGCEPRDARTRQYLARA